MATFNANEYKTRLKKILTSQDKVLVDISGKLQKNPQTDAIFQLDLQYVFGVPDPATREELADWNKRFLPSLNKSKLAGTKGVVALKSILEALKNHDFQTEKAGFKRGQTASGQTAVLMDFADPASWAEVKRLHQDITINELKTYLGKVKASYPLGVITVDELKQTVAAVGLHGTTEKSLVRAAEAIGLQVFPTLEIPELSDLAPGFESSWNSLMRSANFFSIIDLLYIGRSEQPKNVEFVDRLCGNGSVIDASWIATAHANANRAAGTDDILAAKTFLGHLKDENIDDRMLQQIVLWTLADNARKRLASNQVITAVRDHFTNDDYFAQKDIERLLHAVKDSGAGAARETTSDMVRRLISEGKLQSAQREFAKVKTAPEDPEYKAVKQLIADKQVAKKTALTAYQDALSQKDFAAARNSIDQAIAIDSEDAALPGQRNAIPPMPPRELRLSTSEKGVSLHWNASPDPGITYTVVRAANQAPLSATAGTVVKRGIATNTYLDTQAQSGQWWGYSVFATREDGVLSEPATNRILLVLPPSNLESSVQPDSVTLRWQNPQGAAATIVSVVTPQGEKVSHELVNTNSCTFGELTSGSTYVFSVSSVYLLESGKVQSDAISLRCIPRSAARPITDFMVTPSDDANLLRASWRCTPEFAVQLWAVPHGTAPTVGSLTSADELRQYQAQELTQVTTWDDGREQYVDFQAPNDIVEIFPATVTDNGLLIGNSAIAGQVPQPRNITSELFGDTLHLAWEWPTGAEYLMRARWNVDGRKRERTITKTAYTRQGGLNIENAPRISDLSVETVVKLEDSEWPSVPVPVPLVVARTVSYHLQIRKAALFGSARSCRIEATTDTPGFVMPVVLILSQQKYMPATSADGRVIAQLNLDFTNANQVVHEVKLGKVSSPFWVRLFSESTDVLKDPNSSELKG